MNLLEIKDVCRTNLNRYTRKAFESIPKIDSPNILDIGCGTNPYADLVSNQKITLYRLDITISENAKHNIDIYAYIWTKTFFNSFFPFINKIKVYKYKDIYSNWNVGKKYNIGDDSNG